MIKAILTYFLFITAFLQGFATQIIGTITDMQGESLPGVNVYIKGTYDGATTNLQGQFLFETYEVGEQTLVASFIGYKNYESQINLTADVHLTIALKEEVNRLSGVTITAGSFEASDENKAVILKPLDIAMTAGATADIPGALNTLPGTTTNAEKGRLFVRGGTANETQAFIDGMLVQNFYTASPNNVPSRSRFSPFLFKGTFFSTGGYSAEYGQALSSVLALNSQDLPDQTQSDISLTSVGADISHTQRWKDGSVYGQVQYTDLEPYNGLINQAYDWKNPFNSVNGTVMLRQKTNKSDMLKVYANYDRSAYELNQPNINRPEGDDVAVTNRNLYFNANHRKTLGAKSVLYNGFSIGITDEDTDFNGVKLDNQTVGFHLKSYLITDISHLSVKGGAEWIHRGEAERVNLEDGSEYHVDFENNLLAGFMEVDYYITNSLTIRGGLRYSHYSLLNRQAVSPRLSMALKTSEYAQLSWAYGQFHQLPVNDILLRSHKVSFERADHYLVNYQFIKNGHTFRAEVYYKDYDDQVKFDALNQYDPLAYSNLGGGYARGLDVFWRDSKTIKNGDFWVSYSFIDTKRDFRDYPYQARPDFAAKHNVSLVYKHWFGDLKTQIGAAYAFNSGRPYNDPNQERFNGSTTMYYSNLSFNFAYLPKPNLIIYASATNLLGRDNVFGYEYEITRD